MTSRVAERLAAATPALRAIPGDALLTAWNETLTAFLDANSPERRDLDPDLLRSTGLSPAGLSHGLRSIGEGMLGDAAAAELQRPHRQREDGFSLVVLPAEPPGLILQSLLPALAARAPVLFKSARAEPHFAPAFLGALGRRLPKLHDAYAAVTWTGGDEAVETPLHASARLVVAYGGEATINALQSAVNRSLIAFGPRLSLGWVGPGADRREAARGMALDIATFDQRGCLSVHAVLAEPDTAPSFAAALAKSLSELALDLPPGRSNTSDRAGVRLAREDADLRGLDWHGDALDAGTVIVDPDPRITPSPGLRTVRIHPIEGVPRLDDWSSRLQGIAVAGHLPATVRRAFKQAGVSRFAPAGQLQATDAAWRNGGIDLAAGFAYGSGGKPDTVSTTTPSSTRNDRGSVR
ncbi:MAG: hypothetical protein F4X59_15565 [Holophagales bacterium]|nr:hypothetical protein [Holophagales bacterium]MXX60221.1 hypothetical protein [Holophagales bacterium]MYC11525.1 hypothetical protein [Holophagales bacterium]MYD20807.1 hypothetical protein [Holophagales bacterium]MYI33700.1 hypothetical protein [Holophagales bacterium]